VSRFCHVEFFCCPTITYTFALRIVRASSLFQRSLMHRSDECGEVPGGSPACIEVRLLSGTNAIYRKRSANSVHKLRNSPRNPYSGVTKG